MLARNRCPANQSFGRSMVEILGVLAIIGVLSVGSLAFYSRAMEKKKVNDLANAIEQAYAGAAEYVQKETPPTRQLTADEMVTYGIMSEQLREPNVLYFESKADKSTFWLHMWFRETPNSQKCIQLLANQNWDNLPIVTVHVRPLTGPSDAISFDKGQYTLSDIQNACTHKGDIAYIGFKFKSHY